jgi:hypothetical protein
MSSVAYSRPKLQRVFRAIFGCAVLLVVEAAALGQSLQDRAWSIPQSVRSKR